MPRRKQLPEPEKRRRSDFGTHKITEKDWRGLPFVAEQRFVRYDTLAEWWDPQHEPAIYELRQKSGEPGPGRGGKRTGLPWPKDFDKRLAAATRIVDQHWVGMDFAVSFQPFAKSPRWVRLTENGLRWIGLNWPETPFPENLRYYEHNDDRRCHAHGINEVRVYLARGGAQAPKHTWISERAIEAMLAQAGSETLSHLPDGVLVIEEVGAWDIRDIEGNLLARVPLQVGQKVAIEVELNRKSYPRLQREILPRLLQEYDYVWYFCEPEARRVITEARTRFLHLDEERARLRVMSLHEHLPHLLDKRVMTPSAKTSS